MTIRGILSFQLLALLLAAALAMAPAARAESPGITQEQADSIIDELRHIRQLLQRMEKQPGTLAGKAEARPAQPRTLQISVAGRPVFGDPDAPVTLVEFVDFQCPFCKRFFDQTYPSIKQDYIDKGLVRLVVKDMPLGFHGEAKAAAQAAHCAGEQDAYWGMHDLLYEDKGKLDSERFVQHAGELGLDVGAYQACLTSGRHLEQIDADAAEAAAAGITGTPSFIVGSSAGDSVEGQYIRGALPYAVFQKAIQTLLDDKS